MGRVIRRRRRRGEGDPISNLGNHSCQPPYIRGKGQGSVKSGGSQELEKSGEKHAAVGNEKTEDGFALNADDEDSSEEVGPKKGKSVCDSLIFDVYRLLGGRRVSRGC